MSFLGEFEEWIDPPVSDEDRACHRLEVVERDDILKFHKKYGPHALNGVRLTPERLNQLKDGKALIITDCEYTTFLIYDDPT